MSFKFTDFPASYRYCQKGMAAAMIGLTMAGFFLRPNIPPIARTVVLSLLLGLAGSVLLLSNFVIIKYPYLSLVEPDDGDPFTHNYASHGSCLYKVLKYVAMITVAVLIVSLAVADIDTIEKALLIIYFSVMLFFLTFLTLFFDPVRHPTIATFIRATLGVGIVLFPFFVISIAIGSVRCWYLLSGTENNFKMSPTDTDR